MARGSGSQPDEHFGEGAECAIVFYEQAKHRDASRANGSGYAKGRGGYSSWQSHHLICLCAVGDRKAKDDATTLLMEKSLYITEWNINEAPNMIGLPMWRKYKEVYQAIDDLPSIGARTAGWAGADPQRLPAHDVDHNTEGGYTDEVIEHLKKNVWNKFNAEDGDHKKGAEWLKDKLKAASDTFQGWLLNRGTRKSGTTAAWLDRANDENWSAPFSMAKKPTKRFAGAPDRALTGIFNQL